VNAYSNDTCKIDDIVKTKVTNAAFGHLKKTYFKETE